MPHSASTATNAEGTAPRFVPPAARTLLARVVDYAGLFPPAALAMRPAVANYAEYHGGPDAWALGRFVVPLARLDEFETAAAPYLPKPERADPWPLSVLIGPNAACAGRIRAFNQKYDGRAVVDAVELKADNGQDIGRAMTALPAGVATYVEISVDTDPRPLIEAIRRAGAYAKMRTGGITEDDFPGSDALLRFLAACVVLRVPFKATAGLHHPLRARQRLTYEPNSPDAVMHGYLNVLLATALLWHGADDAVARAALEESERSALRFGDDTLVWCGHRLGAPTLSEIRRFGMNGFGSCSFREPIDELHSILAP